MNAVDTNVLVYAVDADETVKQPMANRLLRDLSQTPGEAPILWQVATEFLSCLRRWESNGRVTASDVEAYVHRVLQTFPLLCPTPAMIDISLDLTRRYSLSHWDSILVAACLDAGVATLYTEDLDDGATYDSVLIVDPFS